MSIAPGGAKNRLNNALAERFQDKSSPYSFQDVVVLLIYWKESDQKFEDEANLLGDLFRDKFHYTVDRFEISAEHLGIGLMKKIESLRTFKTAHSLTIIHYGGHADADDIRLGGAMFPRQKCVWAARSRVTNEDMKLEWSSIQPLLEEGKGDFLIILDSCFAAQAARSASAALPDRVALLASASMGCEAPGAGPGSFTRKLILEIEIDLSTRGYTDVTEVHRQLASADRKLMQTPVYFPHSNGSIRLEPHLANPDQTLFNPKSLLKLEMIVSSPFDDAFCDKLAGWLTRFVPREVWGIEVTQLVNKTVAAQEFVTTTSEESQTRHPAGAWTPQIGKLPEESQSEVKNAWFSFTMKLWNNLRSSVFPKGLTPITSSAFEKPGIPTETQLLQFLQSFDDSIALLSSIIERNIMSSPGLMEDENVTIAIDDQSQDPPALVELLGLADSLRMRLQNFRFDQSLSTESSLVEASSSNLVEFFGDSSKSKPGCLVSDTHPKHQRVLVEYSYCPNDDAQDKVRNDYRMKHLVDLLKAPGAKFRTLSCVGWQPIPDKHQYGLYFKNPYDDRFGHITLFDIIEDAGRRKARRFARPSLGQRFLILQKIGETLLNWHNVSWLHESISSQNIVFFYKKEANKKEANKKEAIKIEYAEPFLCGFSFSRYTSQHSVARQSDNDRIRDLYQHPDRQGTEPLERHSKEYDLYSFGVLMFELGFWTPMPTLYDDLVKRDLVGNAQDKMLGKIRNLEPEMGTGYAAATRLCLSKEWGIKEDDAPQSRLARAFDQRVLRKLAVGAMLDS